MQREALAAFQARTPTKGPSRKDRDVAKLLKDQISGFTGKDRRSMTLNTFLEAFKTYATFQRYSNSVKPIALGPLLCKDALQWYNSLDKEQLDWETFRVAFIARFSDPLAKRNARNKLH